MTPKTDAPIGTFVGHIAAGVVIATSVILTAAYVGVVLGVFVIAFRAVTGI